MLNQDAINLGQSISDFGAVQQTKLEQLEAARVAALAAAANVAPRVDKIESAEPQSISIYWRASGDDANDGTNHANAVSSLERVCELSKAHTLIYVYIDSTVLADTYHQTKNTLFIFKPDPDGNNPKIHVIDATNHPDFCGCIWATQKGGGLRFEDIVIHLDSDASLSYGFVNLDLATGSTSVWYYNITFSQSATNTVPLMFPNYGARLIIDFTNSPIAAIAGKVIQGIIAGGPADFRVSSNINSF